MSVDRKPILNDPEIIWPGSIVKIRNTRKVGTVLHSNCYGSTYTVQLPDGTSVTLSKHEVKEKK